MIILYILLAIFVLLFMIMIHETGHYLAGKLLKFKIEEFSIGFGKPIFSKKLKSGEVFSLRWIPLGGFCAFHGEDDDAKEDDAECFNSYAPWKRLIVLFSGAFFNFISAVIFCLILLVSVGSGITQITNVVATNENKDLLKSGDIILEVEGVEPTFLNGSVSGLIANKKAGEDIVLKLDRNGEILDVTIQKYEEFKMENDSIVTDEEGNPIVVATKIGIETQYVKYSFGHALIKCVPYTFQMAWECLVVLGDLVTGQLGIENIGGPITTIETIATSTQANAKNLLLLFPLIAVNLAVFNLLPIPALDGARMVFVLIEWIFRKPVPRNIEAKIHAIGLFALFGLVIIIDLLHIFLF